MLRFNAINSSQFEPFVTNCKNSPRPPSSPSEATKFTGTGTPLYVAEAENVTPAFAPSQFGVIATKAGRLVPAIGLPELSLSGTVISIPACFKYE